MDMTNPDKKKLDAQVVSEIKKQIAENTILIYMKGSPEMPRCGFSAKAIEVLATYHQPFVYVDILENSDIRATLPHVASWPTFPQLYIQGEFIGGSDIILELHQKGELKELIEQASVST